MIKQAVGLPGRYSQNIGCYGLRLLMTVVRRLRIILFWLINWENMTLNSFRNVASCSASVDWSNTEVWLFFVICAYVYWTFWTGMFLLKGLKWRDCVLFGGGGVGNWALLVRISGWVLLVEVVHSSWVASRRYQISVNCASLVIRGVNFATQSTFRWIASWFHIVFWVVLTTAFDTLLRLLTVCFGMSISLASLTLDYVSVFYEVLL